MRRPPRNRAELRAEIARRNPIRRVPQPPEEQIRSTWRQAAVPRIERMLARLGVLLEAACADPDLRLADLPLDAEIPLPAEDAGIFAEIWND